MYIYYYILCHILCHITNIFVYSNIPYRVISTIFCNNYKQR